jgi:hypothetical protein
MIQSAPSYSRYLNSDEFQPKYIPELTEDQFGRTITCAIKANLTKVRDAKPWVLASFSTFVDRTPRSPGCRIFGSI